MAEVFRKSSLEKLSSPEQLDKMIVITSPTLWLSLAGAAGIVIAALLWGIFGRLPTEVDSYGIYVNRAGVQSVYAKSSGTVSEILVTEGSEVKRGDIIALLDSKEIDDMLWEYEERIAAVEAVTMDSENDVYTPDNKSLMDVKNQMITLYSALNQDQALLEYNIVPPEILGEYLKNFSKILQIITEIEKKGDYEPHVFDLSLGKGLPVVCGVIVDKQRQTFGVKFGAHPNIAVAIERVFSESMQGRTLEQFCRISYPSFEEYSKTAYTNLWNLIKIGVGYNPARLFYKTPSYEFIPWEDVSQMGNHALMKKMIAKMEELGGDVYIEDVSFLGFPSVFIYAQGISETSDMDMLFLKRLKLYKDVQETMRHLDTATDA